MHSDRIADVLARVATPPDDARAMARWWWFGPAVRNPELERDLRAMKAGGFGGVEIQPVYPMELDDATRGIRNVPYLSTEFLDSISFANNKAHELGLRVDMTLGSGWPFGGPHVSVADSAGRLVQRVVEVQAGATSVSLPALASGEQLLAAFIGAGNAKEFDATRLRPIIAAPSAADRAAVTPAGEPRVAVFYVASHTGQQVKRPSLGAEGFVLDHLNRRAIDNHLRVVGEPLLKAFGDKPPYAVFSDSLEVYNTDWTEDFLAEFQRRRGYDLKPHLAVIFTGQGPDAAALRHDWALTQTELVNERYLTPLDDWARKHGTQFRSQTYGEPVVTMSSNRLVALPEGEGPQFRSFSFTRWATSAGHLYGRNVISAETWTWLNSPAFSATPLDMKAEADRMLLQGVNQFIGHGWPHTPSAVQEPGYAFYAAAVFNDHQPWWNVMPDVNAYLQRTSYLLRQGAPANEVAVFLPVDDAYASMNPGHMSVSAEMGKFVTPALMEQVLDAGHNADFVDAESVLALGVSHKVLVMPRVSRLSPAVLAKLDAYVRGGGKIIAVAGKPSLAPGYIDATRVAAQVSAASRTLFSRSGVQYVADDAEVGAALARAAAPDFKVATSASDVGFIHRKLADGDIYFIANTSNRPVRTTASLRAPRRYAAWIDPATGALAPASLTATASAAAGLSRSALPLALAPYESRILVLTDTPAPLPASASDAALAPADGETTVADLSRDWLVTFPGRAPEAMATLQSWTENE
ncbi:MAG TPA: glycosyl hydrolase, partial [Pseudoduganella sp.]